MLFLNVFPSFYIYMMVIKNLEEKLRMFAELQTCKKKNERIEKKLVSAKK